MNQSWKNFSSNASTSAEIRSHSSVLFNERLNGLFAMYDMEAMDMEIKPNINRIIKTNTMLKTIWRNIRPIVMNNPTIRNHLGLQTTHAGLYTIDVGFAHIQECMDYMINTQEFTYDKLKYCIQQIQNVENIIREILQYFSYFIRTDSIQKPDISIASKKYEEMADERTVEEFNELLGDKKRGVLQQSLEVPVEDEYFDDMVGDLETGELEEPYKEDE